MGALPPVPLAVGTTLVGGTEVPIRSLTRAEALELRAMAGEPDADRRGEIFLIARGTGADATEAEAWWESSDPIAVGKLVEDIAVVSRLRGKDGTDPNAPASAPSSRASSR
jgi:hypothetical protein